MVAVVVFEVEDRLEGFAVILGLFAGLVADDGVGGFEFAEVVLGGGGVLLDLVVVRELLHLLLL